MEKPKVAIVRIKNGDFLSAVKKAIELAGGLPDKIEKDILIKPNILTFKKTEEETIPIITNPEVVRSIIKIVKEKDYKSKIYVADSSGSGLDTSKVIEKTGFSKLEEEGVTVCQISSNGSTEVEPKNPLKLKKTTFSNLSLNSVIINVPKMKTHTLTRVTLAIKNLFGTIPGMEKSRIHAVGNTAKGFSKCLVDIYSVLKDNIIMNVMDASIAMEGHGPSHGSPVKMDLILASKDAVALDAVATSIMDEKPSRVFTTRIASENNYGVSNLDDIEIVGEKIDDVKHKFKMPEKFISFLPIGIFFQLNKKQPEYKGSGCIACLRCQKICPVQAIVVDKKEKRPYFDYTKCISCFSCNEICPEGVITITRLKYKKQLLFGGFIGLAFIALILVVSILLA
ncbi:MAG: DUF362 domain-containing protein [Candidatus Heimdallarchaeaceae archaeon]